MSDDPCFDVTVEEPLAVLIEPLPAGVRSPVPLGTLVKLSRAALDEDDAHPSHCTHVCPVCGTQFFDRRNKLYCSHECQKKAYKLRRKGVLQPVFVPGQNSSSRAYDRQRTKKINRRALRRLLKKAGVL